MNIKLGNMVLPSSKLFLGCLLLFLLSDANAQDLQNTGLPGGQPLMVGGNKGVGPLASIGISSTPIGSAFIFGGERPDIFVSSDRWYPGFHLFRWIRDTPEGLPIF